MKMEKDNWPILRPRLWDGVVILLVLMSMAGSALAVWRVPETNALTAVVIVDRESEERINLRRLKAEESRTIFANGYTLELRLSEDGIAVYSSDCPTQECVRTGTITRAGQSIVCLPARVVIRLESGSGADDQDDEVDAIVG